MTEISLPLGASATSIGSAVASAVEADPDRPASIRTMWAISTGVTPATMMMEQQQQATTSGYDSDGAETVVIDLTEDGHSAPHTANAAASQRLRNNNNEKPESPTRDEESVLLIKKSALVSSASLDTDLMPERKKKTRRPKTSKNNGFMTLQPLRQQNGVAVGRPATSTMFRSLDTADGELPPLDNSFSEISDLSNRSSRKSYREFSARRGRSSSRRSLDRFTVINRSLNMSRKALSSDFLDYVEEKPPRSGGDGVGKMHRIEKNVYLGSMEAATDVILLESSGITHIVTIDSISLPRKITSMLPRIALLHLQVTDLADEDLLTHLESAIDFIEEGLRGGGSVLVHCYRGKSRSATVVIAYIMRKYKCTMEKALAKVKSKRPIVSPNPSFIVQLKLYENMEYCLDRHVVQYKMFILHMASERMRKAKVLFRDTLELIMDDDPGDHWQTPKCHNPVVYKCKKCRRTLGTSENMMPHIPGEDPVWTDGKWALPAEAVLESSTENGLQLCSQSVFLNPVRWMQTEIKQHTAGKLYCPHCQGRVGEYSWMVGSECGCGANVVPAFRLDVTEIIFKTKNRYLQPSGREPVVV